MLKGIRRFLYIVRCLPSLAASKEYKSILLLDLTHSKTHNQQFLSIAEKALKRIESVDPRRFKRIQNNLNTIANCPSELYHSWGSYMQKKKTCTLNIDSLCSYFEIPTEDTNACSALISPVIIHEATHGHLISLGFEYGEDTWKQSERICHQEEMRFAKKLGDEFIPCIITLLIRKTMSSIGGQAKNGHNQSVLDNVANAPSPDLHVV